MVEIPCLAALPPLVVEEGRVEGLVQIRVRQQVDQVVEAIIL